MPIDKFRGLERTRRHTLPKDFLATYKCFHSKIRIEARLNKRYTYRNMLFKNYDSIYFRNSRDIIKCSVKYCKNLGTNIHMQIHTVFKLIRPLPPLFRQETVGLLRIHTVLTNSMEDGFSHFLYPSLKDLQTLITILFNMEIFLGPVLE